MVQITLQPAEFCEVEFPCNDTLQSIGARAIGGKCVLALQTSRDGLTWHSPIVHARLHSEMRQVPLVLPEGTRKLRAVIENASDAVAHVEIEDPKDSLQPETQEEVASS